MQKRTLSKALIITAVIGAVLLCGDAGAWAQSHPRHTKMMIKSYDLLEAGKFDAAQKIYEQVLQEDPGNPLALNNLAAIMVKKGKKAEALAYLKQALPKAKGYKVMVNRVCQVNGVCLAFRPLQEVYGNQELEPLIRLNLRMLQGKPPAPLPGK
jgi:tetratricopeptide (TPR) repeat protein